MKQINYEVKESGFEGTVVISVPNQIERLRFLKECNFQTKQVDGKLVMDTSGNTIEAVATMLELSKKHIVKVSLKHGETCYNSFDDMLDDPNCDTINMKIASIVMNGVVVGGN